MMAQDLKGKISLDGGSTWHDATVQHKAQALSDNTQFDIEEHKRKLNEWGFFATLQIEPSMIGAMRQVVVDAQQAVKYQEILSRALKSFHQEYYGSFIDDTQK